MKNILLIFIAGMCLLNAIFLGEIWLTLEKMYLERSFRVTAIDNDNRREYFIKNFFVDIPSGIGIEKWEDK